MLFAVFIYGCDYVHIHHQYCNKPSILKTTLGISYGETFPVQWTESVFVPLSHFVIL